MKFDITNGSLSKFNDAVLSVILTSTLQKMKYIRSNNCNFMIKELRRAITNRSKLRNNFYVSLLRKRRVFEKLDHRVASDNRRFWKSAGPLFLEKAFDKESIILNSNNKTINNNEELAEIFNKHFSKLVKTLDIGETLADNIARSDITDPVFYAIKT